MRTVGEILKKERLSKNLSFEEIEKTLRIRKKFLLALEENAWDKLPSLPYIKGFLRNYSSFLGLSSEEIVAIFRRQFAQQEKSRLLPRGITNPLNEPMFRFTPQITVAIIITSFIILFFGYLTIQYLSFTSPPYLDVSKPAEGEIIKEEFVQIMGKTDIDAVISINNQKIALSQNGEFSTTLTLTPGVNTIVVESTSKYGKKKTISRTIQVQNKINQ